ncbi:MAG: hypothetical protein AAF901_02565, partial [Bacteroidota bacterium]
MRPKLSWLIQLRHFLMLLFPLSLLAQGPAKELNFYPLSPEASEMLRYDDFPVTTHTGIPNISLPLYTISLDGLNL